ncbi:MAG: hypothetical protein RL375_1505 [Pseudomonadota bacterium]|jgi:hypothetical protein
MRSTVFGASGGMCDDARLGARLASLHVAKGTVEAITQDMEPGAMDMGSNGIGHWVDSLG